MSYDQHFMINKDLIKSIINHAKIKKTDIVLEIGPGTGNLTEEIYKKTKKLIIIEIDKNLISNLKEKFPKIEVINKNALEIDLPEHNKLLSNLPYNICEPLIWKLIKYKFNQAILTVPETFFEALNSNSKIGILAQTFYKVNKILEVEKEDFDPPPKTKSVVIELIPKKSTSELNELFLQSDKKIKNILIEIFTKRGLTKNDAKTKLLFLPKSIGDKRIKNISDEKFKKVLKIIHPNIS